eukprot:m.98231 g.98231  ORF g.98231 m.98231 type:complete len:57 (+) comp36973_c0_seq15:1117-1287(+)
MRRCGRNKPLVCDLISTCAHAIGIAQLEACSTRFYSVFSVLMTLPTSSPFRNGHEE